jgi:hypothetical protein
MNMKWINASDIKNWPNNNSRQCSQMLPELVRRLVLATTSSIKEINFPSGDSVTMGGWDGKLDTDVVVPFFPSGLSAWEIGIQGSAKTKADADYLARTSDPLGLSLEGTVFVFVTPRIWPGRNKWQEEKRSTNTWKDVRVINADELEQWLESAPAVALWLAHQIGKVISNNVMDLETVWGQWVAGTKPAMTSDLVIGGRIKDVEVVKQWIAEKPRILEVQADHSDEAPAFLYASIDTFPDVERAKALARCVFVEGVSEFRQLVQAFQSYPLIIVAHGECIDVAHDAVAKGHHVFISMDTSVACYKGGALRLSRPRRDLVEKVLQKGGLSAVDAQRIATDSGRSIPVLRRNLFQSDVVSAPSWVNAESAQILLPVLFANAWDEGSDGDRQVIETLSGMDYADFIKELTPFISIDDSPIRKVGSVWMIKSSLDAWFLLAPYLTQDHLKFFKQSVLIVLTKTNPKYELKVEERWAAAVYGKSNPYSEWLRAGLVESLALIAVHSNCSPSIITVQAFVNGVVREVFDLARKWEFWASIKDVTALLAEAAPVTFMESVEQVLVEEPELFEELMKDEGGLFGECKHSGLLWALESMAWSSEYFARSTGILAKFADIDSGGNWHNRPTNSLKNIFLQRFPQTHAKPEERIAVIDGLIKQYPRIVWEFTHDYYGTVTFSESHRFRWRDSGGIRRGLEPEAKEDGEKYAASLSVRLSESAVAEENIIDSVDEFIRLPNDVQDRLLVTLEKIDLKDLSGDKKADLLVCIRDVLNWINSHGKKEILKKVPTLNELLEKFTPKDVIERVGWLFSTPWPRLPQGESEQFDDKNTAVKTAQQEAARELLNKVSLGKIVKFSKTVAQGVIGYSLAMVVSDQKEDEKVLDAILKHTTGTSLFIGNYARGRVEATDSNWINQQIRRMKIKGNYSPKVCALLYLGLPEGSDTWSALSGCGKDAETEYWKRASGYSRANKNEDAPIAVEKLLNAKRPSIALQIAGDSKVSIPSVLLQRLLQEILVTDEKTFHAGAMSEYHLGHIFNQLYERNELSLEEIAKLEWPFAALFKDIERYTSTSMALHRMLQQNPKFFTQLISFTYKQEGGTAVSKQDDIPEDKARDRARVAYEVLNSWSLVPGSKDDGSVDEKELVRWVEAVRKQCAENGYIIGCDIQIGFMIANAPVNPDGVWPHVAVRNLIERLDNKIVDKHVQNQIYNNRGVVSRGPNDGGKQERGLAGKYKKMSEAMRVKWPRTAAIFQSLAESYEGEARREDVDSDLHELKWG